MSLAEFRWKIKKKQHFDPLLAYVLEFLFMDNGFQIFLAKSSTTR
jgi:hypothetical protein